MFEPTESECLEELDRLILAMKTIRQELREIENGEYTEKNNVLKNAPHNIKLTMDWQIHMASKRHFIQLNIY